MISKRILLICLSVFNLVISVTSFTIVVDTSGSMSDELETIKSHLSTVINVHDDLKIKDYIVIPFSDSVVAEPTVVSSFSDLLIAVNRLSLKGHSELCPEPALTGIEKALEVSKPRSTIFLFTDAYPKDVEKVRSIENLCRNKLSQVVIFLTGYCPNSPLTAVQAYYEVAASCKGAVFQLKSTELRHVFKYMRALVQVQWSDVVPYDAFSENKEIGNHQKYIICENVNFLTLTVHEVQPGNRWTDSEVSVIGLTFYSVVNSFTKTILLAVSGKNVRVELSRTDNYTVTFENVVSTRQAKVIRLIEAPAGDYSVKVTSQNITSLILYKKFYLPLQIGFSSVRPRSMRETAGRPMPGRQNYILFDVLSDFKLDSIAIQLFNEEGRTFLPLEELATDHYLTNVLIYPDRSFHILVNGTDKVTNKKVTGSTDSIIPQVTIIDTRWFKPTPEILEGNSITVNYGTKATLACKVKGYPKPSVQWKDEQSTFTGPLDSIMLEMPSVYIAYYNIENITSNLTLYCKCKNAKGEDSRRIDVTVYRPYTFEVIQTPQDESIEYGTEGKVHCEVNAYPEAVIKWYHNDSLVTVSDNYDIIPEESVLVIKYMNLNNVGEYKCEISSSMNFTSYTAYLGISGIEPPQVEVDKPNITLVLGDWSSLECRIVKGKPLPEIIWKFKSIDAFDFDILPSNVSIEDGKLKIASAQMEHSGIFRCEGNNIEGQHSSDITVTVQFSPIILDNETKVLVVKEDDDVALDCAVNASPAAEVWWEKTQDDVMVALDYSHVTDEYHVHRFKATGQDSGDYHCVAQNNLGRSMKIITVKVLVKPYIQAPKSDTVTVRAGGAIHLACNIVVGNPVPATKWQFIAVDSITSTLRSGNGSIFLHMTNLRHDNEGWYMCIAENEIGKDNIKIYVKVQ